MGHDIGQNIKFYRTESGISRELIAEKLKISLAAISSWENGISVPEPRKILPLCELLGITPNMLYGFSDQPWTQGLDDYEISVVNGYRAASMSVKSEILRLSQDAMSEPAVDSTPFIPCNSPGYSSNIKKCKMLKLLWRASGLSLNDLLTSITAKHPDLGCCLSEEFLLQGLNAERCPSVRLIEAMTEAMRPAFSNKLDRFNEIMSGILTVLCILGATFGGAVGVLNALGC